MTEQRSRPSPHLRAAASCLFLAILTFSTFRPVLHNGFVDWDDRDEVADNPDFIHPGFQAITHYWAKPFRGLYIPLTYTAWGLIASVARTSPQLDPVRFHLASVAVHAAAAIVVFFLIRRLVQSELAACFAGAVFAVHPMQVEAVAWVESFYTVLGGFFSLAALYAYLVFVDRRSDPRRGVAVWSIYALATVLYVAALLAKPSAVVVPLLAAVLAMLQRFSRYSLAPDRRRRHFSGDVRAMFPHTISNTAIRQRPLHRELLPLGCWLLLAAPISLVARTAQSSAVAYTTTWPMRLVIALDSIAFYFCKLIASIGLIPDYGRSPRWAQSHPWALLDVVVPPIIFAAAWICRRRFPWVLASLAICTISLLPVLGFVPFSFQRYSTVADRYFYVGMLGPALVVGYLLAKGRSKILIAVTGTAIIVWASLSFAQSRRWHDSQRLFDYTLSLNPQSAAANYVLGSITASAALQERASARSADQADVQIQINRAIGYYSQALRTDPASSEVLFNLGNLYRRTGQLEPAVDTYERAVRGQAPTAEMWNNLGIALTELGRDDQAAIAFATAVRIDPLYADAEANWGLLLLSGGDNSGAAAHFHRALTIRPDCTAASRGLDRIRQAGRAS